MLRLVKPSKEYLPAFLKVIDDYRADDNHFGRGEIDSLIKAVDTGTTDEWFQKTADFDTNTNLPADYVPGTTFWLLDDDEWIGSFNVRHRLTESLEQLGGHIGANIAPRHRGGYSSFIGIKLCLAQARKLGLDRVLMTCNANNAASYRAIMGLVKLYGGEQIPDSIVGDQAQHRAWVNTPK